ncbi:MAG: N-6 DNA methylase [Rhizobium rhizophilum]|uniref:class I SAM-dependent DNA methyltransferase n=1 Tax=Rhizobium rhizophilum TaxID=1850373 RepID=UPI003919E7B1
MSSSDIVQKLWSLSSVLRDDGMVYHQYMSELTYILFLKIAQETGAEQSLPEGYRWGDLVSAPEGAKLSYYRKMLTHLGEDAPNDDVRKIFAFPTTVFNHEENLRLVLERVDGLAWYSASRDDFGDIYEGLLEKNAVEAKAGAGQYFTPRAVIDTIVSLVKPAGTEIVQDPAVGTGGFLVSANNYARKTSSDAKLRCQGVEIVKDTYRLCLMNLFLHGLNSKLIHGDALSDDYRLLDPADVVITNPPFGSRGGGGAPRRADLAITTANKQLMFVQHIYTTLKDGGRAAVVLPDNVLFEGNAAQRVRNELLSRTDLHTVLRLPNGIFYAGVKTSVLFFTRRDNAADTNSRDIWFYDARTNVPSFGKRSPLNRDFFEDFERCFGTDPYGQNRDPMTSGRSDRWKRYSREDVTANGENLDISWLKEERLYEYDISDADEITAHLTDNLNVALQEVKALSDLLLLKAPSNE